MKDVQVVNQISEWLIYFAYSTVIIHNNYASNMSFCLNHHNIFLCGKDVKKKSIIIPNMKETSK